MAPLQIWAPRKREREYHPVPVWFAVAVVLVSAAGIVYAAWTL